MYFETYEDAKKYAREEVVRTGRPCGLERWRSALTPGKAWRVFMLPSQEHRAGHELTCEAVEC